MYKTVVNNFDYHWGFYQLLKKNQLILLFKPGSEDYEVFSKSRGQMGDGYESVPSVRGLGAAARLGRIRNTSGSSYLGRIIRPVPSTWCFHGKYYDVPYYAVLLSSGVG